ncbi:AzlD domain-containing protein [Lactiplantibacillus plantarum]|uniref:AzlD domain-containing protein n=1 Tax=Lactiplantibacillus plantarum TaxID=1590 RepID=UPI000FF8D18B|nr:AzlD domain-containing protein [Lactiplantibacillus plantarum]MBP5834845.1 AzlD domain-containing protein [Lactiplantibacillus plantarum]MBU7470352.1 AzlD domain-containing protein [Lactiplantibacillus plantarum]QAR90326.1 AzlD domain-containing protein [Lactiplantibacillus plantarum]
MQSVSSMSSMDHFWLVIFCACVAFIPRFFPLLFFTKRKIPEWFNEWMRFVPVSLFTALVVKSVFIDSKYAVITSGNLGMIISAILVGFVAYRTRSMTLSVVIGLISVMIFVLLIHI